MSHHLPKIIIYTLFGSEFRFCMTMTFAWAFGLTVAFAWRIG